VDKSVGIKVKYCILLDGSHIALFVVKVQLFNNINHIQECMQLQQVTITCALNDYQYHLKLIVAGNKGSYFVTELYHFRLTASGEP
jgi:hypothetical protein